MNNKLKNVLVFTVGATVGSIVAWNLARTKYELIAQQEIDSVKEMYAKKSKDGLKSDEKIATDEELVLVKDMLEENRKQVRANREKPDLAEMAESIRKTGHVDYTAFSAKNKKEEPVDETPKVLTPYVIAPEEFGCCDDNQDEEYETICLTYYDDGVLTDDGDDVISPEGYVGIDALNHFGDYEEDIVHVRNHKLKVDFEIVRDHRRYEIVMDLKPHQMVD